MIEAGAALKQVAVAGQWAPMTDPAGLQQICAWVVAATTVGWHAEEMGASMEMAVGAAIGPQGHPTGPQRI